MRLSFRDTIVFTSKDGHTKRGAAIRYDVRQQVVVVKVLGPAFHWEGGPPGEDLDAKGNLLPGQIGYADALYLVPVASIQSVIPAPPMSRVRRAEHRA